MAQLHLKPSISSHITGSCYIPYKKYNVFVVGDTDGKMTLYDRDFSTTTGSFDVKLHKDDEESLPIQALAFFNHSIITAVCEPKSCFSIRVGETDGKIYSTMYEFDSSVDAVAVASPGQQFAYVGDGNRVVFFTKEGQIGNDLKIQSIKTPQNRATFATYDSEGKYLIVHADDGSLSVIDAVNQMVVKTLGAILPASEDILNGFGLKYPNLTIPVQSSFQYPFTGSQTNLAVPTKNGIAIFNSKAWSQTPVEINKKAKIAEKNAQNAQNAQNGQNGQNSSHCDEEWFSCLYSPNNALLAVLTNTKKVHIIDMIDSSHPILTTVELGSILEGVKGFLTQLSWGPQSNEGTESNKNDLILTGTDGLIITVTNLIDSLPHNAEGAVKISHKSSAAEIAVYLGRVLKERMALKEEMKMTAILSPNGKKSSKNAKFSVESDDEDDDDEDQIVIRSVKKIPTEMKDGSDDEDDKKKSKEKKQSDEKMSEKSEKVEKSEKSEKIHQSEKNKRKAPTQVDSSTLSDTDDKATTSVKRQRTNFGDSDDDDGSSDSDDDNDDDADIRDASKNIKLQDGSLIQLEKLEDMIKDDLDDYYRSQFRKSFLMTRDTNIQPPFMPTSTTTVENKTTEDKMALLHSSEHGTIVSRLHNKDTTIAIVLNAPKRVERMSLPFERTPFNMATMDFMGILLAAPSHLPTADGLSKTEKGLKIPSQIHYQAFDSEREMQFSLTFPPGEEVECIALSKDVIAVATNRGFLRLFDLTGIELEVMSLPGRILTMTAKGPYLAVFYHNNSVPLAGSHNVSMQLIHTEMLHVLYDSAVAITPLSNLLWAYISPTGLVYTGDSDHIIRMFSTARGNSWKVVCDLNQHIAEKGYSYWPLYVEYTELKTPLSPPSASHPTPASTWSHRIYTYELYNRFEPIPQGTMPNPKPVKMMVPFARFTSSTATTSERNIQSQFEQSLRERIMWDELVSTHGQGVPQRLGQQFDTPWIQLCLQMAQHGQTVSAIYAAKQVRDLDLLFKTIEKLNSMPHLPNVDLLIVELKQILVFKRQFKKLGLFPYQNPLPHAAMFKSKEIATMASQPPHPTVNPFASPQVPRTAGATAPYVGLVRENGNGAMVTSSSNTPATNNFSSSTSLSSANAAQGPSPTTATPIKDNNPFSRASATPQSGNPFRK